MNLSEIYSKVDEALKIISEAAKDDQKTQKKIAIAQTVMNASHQLVADMQKISHYEKKLPRIVRKFKYSKKESARLKLIMLLNLEMNRMQMRIIQQQPIPKFPKGGITSSTAYIPQ